ncbi:beta-galactosidase [Paraglaciecola aquimarina]|uniref:beta-galactosidase n=1 Tax=Paraglaciecola aquimarina TaxID=1235557 RepID=A0ABU3SYZ0_9ALTE|nr:beta-galactosidase [Paraglaciecola aquimarina]MDU0355222.1 beta-galactosidase [Paraglaciecola aquimarina]
MYAYCHPPKWLIDKYPSILPVDINTGNVRGFGSRRHYDFSSPDYLREALKISEIVAKRYGQHPSVIGWQTDNEIACHDTCHSGSEHAKLAFQQWCKNKYQDIDCLNSAWGTVFWSMEYQDFSQIELPILAVTETHPAHQLAYRRFSSDQVVHFHDEMIKVIRQHAPNRWVTHNFIPMADTQTDNYALAKNLDFVSYDNYPLGRSDLFFANAPAEKFKPYMRTGHPDYASYAFDQSRGISNQNFWIMEQQLGPVNWALHNPRPEKGMVRLWSWQAFAHGADCVCFFRWRQAPFAQEQMHAGIKRNDNSPAQAWHEVEQLHAEMQQFSLKMGSKVTAKVAIVTGTLNQWVTEIEIQGTSYSHLEVEFSYYSALRQLGVAVDFISTEDDLSNYDMVVAPCLPIVSQAFVEKCKASHAHFIFGPRSGAKTDELSLAPNLGPGLLQQLIPIKVLTTETIRPDCSETMTFNDKQYESSRWREELEINADITVLASDASDSPMVVQKDNVSYIATLTCDQFLQDLFEVIAEKVGVNTIRLAKDMRIMQRDNLTFIFNYSGNTLTFPTEAAEKLGRFVVGKAELAPYDVAVIEHQ